MSKSSTSKPIREFVRGLHPYVCLVLLAIPVALAEPLKLTGLLVIGTGHWMSGLAVLGFGYALSVLVVTRLFKLLQPRLLKLPWFKKLWNGALKIHSVLLARVSTYRQSLLHLF
jgi:hypothetical protein